MENIKFPIRVSCMTFNHAPYIEDAMNGFTMQKTTFPFICVIIDDASTDGEQEVIRRYLQGHFELDNTSLTQHEENEDYELFFSRHKDNYNCYFLVILLKYNHYSIKKSKAQYFKDWVQGIKYIALCEGDDYWINKDKLQLQVDFLDNNPDYTLCFHNAIVHYEYGNVPDRLFSHIEKRDYTGNEIFDQWIIPTASVVLKSSVRKMVGNNNKFIYGDTPLFLSCASSGKIRGFDNIMSVYRRTTGGITHIQHTKGVDWFKKRAHHNLEIYKVFGDSYKKTSIRNYSLLMISGFAESIKNKNIRYDFIRESLNVSVSSTIKACWWKIKKTIKESLIKKVK